MYTLVQPQDLSPEFIKLISLKRGIPEQHIKDMCAHNVLTINQVVAITGNTVAGVQQLVRPRYKGGDTYTVLTPVFPFPEMKEDETGSEMPVPGRMFILRDQNFYDYVKKRIEQS